MTVTPAREAANGDRVDALMNRRHEAFADTDLIDATLDDVPAVLRMLGTTEEMAFWSGDRFGLPVDRDRFAAHIQSSGRQHEQHRCFSLVSRRFTGPIGYGELTRIDEAAGHADLSRILIAPVQRSNGMGTLLVRALIAEAERRGMTALGLRVFERNHHGLRLYERLGFVRTGQTHHRHIQGKDWPAVEMTLEPLHDRTRRTPMR